MKRAIIVSNTCNRLTNEFEASNLLHEGKEGENHRRLYGKTSGRALFSMTDHYSGYIRLYGTYTEYRVIAGIPAENVMLEIIGVENGVLLTRVNNTLFENGRGFLQ